MKQEQDSNPQTLTVALLTVGVDQDITEKIVQAATQHHWTVTHDSFEEYVSAARRPAISGDTKGADAVLAIIDFDRDPKGAAETAAYLHQLFFGRFFAAALSAGNDPDLLLTAMRSGCNEVLKNPLDLRQLADTFDRQERQWAATMGRARSTGHILSLFGAKGGVGTTTIAVTLAYYLVRQKNKRVLLIDNHPEFGHICLYLGLDGTRYHFDELIRNVNRLDSTLLRGFIAKHPSGLEVLSSPESHDLSRSVDPDALERTLEFLRGEYDYILLDCETSLEETSLAVMDRSDQIYLVATPDIGAIRDLSRYIDGLSRNESTSARMHVVINRYSSHGAIAIEQIEKAIRVPVEVRLCNAYAECQRAINVGEPIGPDKKSEISSQFARWTNLLSGEEEQPKAQPARKGFSLFGQKRTE
ncbi:MAG TPA: AAA family ATPase [Acidobacteriaceae bacterium]|jgi:pilus assembly protein CpaE|nr:AAA family ATPase [Acidobacteriaceae bacterium]